MTTTLAGKLAAAALKVGGRLATDKRNTDQKYDYISADKILAECGQALAEQGIIIIPAVIDEQVDAVAYKVDRVRYDAVVKFAMVIADGATQMESLWIGRGSDYTSPDKATYKAITSGHKYFLSKLLAVGAGNEDGEHEVPPAPPMAAAPGVTGHTPAAGVNWNGAAPVPEDGWDPAWSTARDYPAAQEWGRKQGKWNHAQHFDSAWRKVFVDHNANKPENAAAFLTAWHEYVVNHPAPVATNGAQGAPALA